MTTENLPNDQYFSNRLRITGAGGPRPWELATFHVVFGWRVVVYPSPFTIHESYALNWCCGANEALLKLTYSLVFNLIKAGVQLKDLPVMSDVKPWPNDEKFVEKIRAIACSKLGSFPDIDSFKNPNRL